MLQTRGSLQIVLLNGFDLYQAAHDEMLHEGFEPDFSPEVRTQVAQLSKRRAPVAGPQIRDLRNLLWSSIDNATSRDLDQIEVAEPVDGGIRVRVGIADVTDEVDLGSPIDQHAESQTTTVYTAVRIFPMLPEELSTGMTSLAPDQDRLAVVIEYVVANDGSISSADIYRALVRNQAQLAYGEIGPWLDGTTAAPAGLAEKPQLQAQLRLQDQAACALREQRHKLGALDFERIEAEPVIVNGKVTGVAARPKNRASNLIEDFMVAANGVMARKLKEAGVATIRRVVKSPERWGRIVELAATYGERLPVEPDSGALNEFLKKRRAADPDRYADLSLAVMKLMGPGEYIMARPGDPEKGHFSLAARDYTHSTAPNRRFADMVIQRLIKAVLQGQPSPYPDDALGKIADNCTRKEEMSRKVERSMNKRVAAVAFHDRIGASFDAIVTGVKPKGTFVRVLNPPVEGRLMRGEQGLDVGDRVRVTLLSTDPVRGYIDFGR